MKTEFLEDYQSPEIEPLSRPGYDDHIDPDTLTDEDVIPATTADDLRRVVGDYIRKFFHFCVPGDFRTPSGRLRPHILSTTGKRLLALAWVVNPANIPGAPSAQDLCELLGIDHRDFSEIAAQVSREFGVTNRAQAHYGKRRRDKAGRPTRREAQTTARPGDAQSGTAFASSKPKDNTNNTITLKTPPPTQDAPQAKPQAPHCG